MHQRPSRQVDEHDSIVEGDETHQEWDSMKANMMGPDHVSKPNVKLFQGSYITNVWETLVRRTTMFIKWMAAMTWKKTGDHSMSASNMAVLF